MEVLREAPRTESFIPLAEHQTTTPASFYTGPPVLHFHSDRCQLSIRESDAAKSPALTQIVSRALTESTNGLHQSNGHDESAEDEKVVDDITIWVTSDKLLLYSPTLSTGISIPYPSICLHAIQSLPTPSAVDTSSQGLYMQLIASPIPSSSDADDEPDSISITLIPPPSSTSAPTTTSTTSSTSEETSPQTTIQSLFNALSDCSNLHPDPASSDADDQDMDMSMDTSGFAGSRLYQAGLLQPGAQDNGLPPPMPGSGGWITAENMHEYIDAEGNWIGPEDDGGVDDEEMEDGDAEEAQEGGAEGLGPGAGTVRSRGEGGEGNGGDETKWRRTD